MVPRTGVCSGARRLLVFSEGAVAVAPRTGCARRNIRAILLAILWVNLWSGVLAGYSTGGLAHPRHFGFFDRKQVA